MALILANLLVAIVVILLGLGVLNDKPAFIIVAAIIPVSVLILMAAWATFS